MKLDPEGWLPIDELIENANRKGKSVWGGALDFVDKSVGILFLAELWSHFWPN
jgi:hypothetical protein